MSDSRMDRLFFALGRATLDKNEPKAHAVIALIDLVKLVGDEQERIPGRTGCADPLATSNTTGR
jgi:hypothetical protein